MSAKQVPAKMQLLFSKAAETAVLLAGTVKCPSKRAVLVAKAQAFKAKANALGDKPCE